MGIWELFVIAVGLSMDAFAISVCKGLSVREVKRKHALTVGLYFGGFQAIMPLLGYFLGVHFQDLITEVDHWIAFILLGIIGGKMIWESRSQEEKPNDSFGYREMLPLAVATSIDALAVGITFAFLHVNIGYAVSFIGVITCLLAMFGIKVGNVFGSKCKAKAEIFGGIILILMGIKILLTHLGILNL